jgi:hypothetical protein
VVEGEGCAGRGDSARRGRCRWPRFDSPHPPFVRQRLKAVYRKKKETVREEGCTRRGDGMRTVGSGGMGRSGDRTVRCAVQER